MLMWQARIHPREFSFIFALEELYNARVNIFYIFILS